MSACWSNIQLTIAADLWRRNAKASDIAKHLMTASISAHDVVVMARERGWQRTPVDPKPRRRPYPCIGCDKPEGATRPGTRCPECARAHARTHAEKFAARRRATEAKAAPSPAAPPVVPDAVALYRAERDRRRDRINAQIDACKPLLEELTLTANAGRAATPRAMRASKNAQRDQAIASAYQRGRSLSQLAAQYGVSASTINWVLRKEGVALRPRGHQAGALDPSKAVAA